MKPSQQANRTLFEFICNYEGDQPNDKYTGMDKQGTQILGPFTLRYVMLDSRLEVSMYLDDPSSPEHIKIFSSDIDLRTPIDQMIEVILNVDKQQL